MKGKVFVVTGGGNGIGREIVLELLRRGASVGAVDINADALSETAELAFVRKDRLSLHQLDITKQAEVEKLPEVIIQMHGCIDGIINNAGIIQPFIQVKDLNYKKIYQVMDVNFYGPLYMIKAFLPYLLKREVAHITNVSSMGGFVPVPKQTIYGASKAALKLLSEGLHSELRDTNIKVTTVFPGGVATNITKNSKAEGTLKINKNMEKMTMKLLSPKKAAWIIVEATKHGSSRVIVGRDSKFMDWFSRHLPNQAAKLITQKLSKIK